MQLPVIFNDRYQLNTELGQGGLAQVYLAQDLALGRMVAVKLLRQEYTNDPTFLVRFHREAQSAASLNSSNVVSVYDFGQDHGRPYIVMEYVPGQDLRSVLDRGLLTVPQVIDYAIQVCNAVGMAHRRGMVHGDLKPGNILISPENRAKVTDFGLARALGESAMDDGELVWGTPAYFAPEQAAGDRVMSATDVYAIGIVLYEMLSGSLPFTGDDDQEIARKQLYEQPVPLSQRTHRVNPDLEAIVNKALAKDPNQRHHDADELKQVLLQFRQGAGLQLQAGDDFKQNPSPVNNGIDWLAIALALLAVLAMLGLVPLWGQVFRIYFLENPLGTVNTPSLSPLSDEFLAFVGYFGSLGYNIRR